MISTSDTEAVVCESVDFVIVCPSNLFGSPLMTSATTISLRINSAPDGLIRKSSKSSILGVTPYIALKRMRNDSAVPFDWYNDLDSLIKLLTSNSDINFVSSRPGVKDDFIFL